MKFAGQSLRFSKGVSNISNQMGGGASTGSQSTIETISQFLKARYQPEIKMLNLSNVKQDPTLTAQGFWITICEFKIFPSIDESSK